MPDKEKQLPQVQVPLEGEWIGSQPASSDYEKGFLDGLSLGMHIGHNYATERFLSALPALISLELKKLQDPDTARALSDGLRHRSSECARALVNRYRYHKLPSTNNDE
ncbi:TPA: hypothetical protein ACIAIE_004078 [Serratia fonticola]